MEKVAGSDRQDKVKLESGQWISEQRKLSEIETDGGWLGMELVKWGRAGFESWQVGSSLVVLETWGEHVTTKSTG